MKKLLRNLLAIAFAAFVFNACEDVPEPYPIPSENGNGGNTVTTIGTADEPITVASALEMINNLSDGSTSTEDAYIKGIVVKVATTASQFADYGNLNYYISDDGKDNNTVYVYGGDGLGGALFSAVTDINAGDEVVVCGKLQKYVNKNTGKMTPEVAKGNYLVKLTQGEGPKTETVGSIDNPQTVAQALTVIASLAENGVTPELYYVKGTIKTIKTSAANIAQYKNIDYVITDDGSNELTVFRGKNLDNTDFTEAGQINVGDEVIVIGNLQKYINANTGAVVPEVAQGNYIVKLTKGTTPGPSDETIGTASSPISVAEALTKINELSEGGKSDNKAYVKGKIVRVATNAENFAKYGNINYYISDDGTDNNTVQVYAGDGLNGAKFSSIDDIAAGDEVVVLGTLYKYVNKSGTVIPEIEGSYLVELTKGGGTTPEPLPGGEAKGTGTLDDPYNAVAANAVATALGEGNTSTENYYIKGKISEIKYTFSAQYGTATFFISDDGTTNNQFQVYSAYYLENKSWVDGYTQIKQNDDVIIYGQLTNYNGTPETASKKAYIYSLNGNTKAEENGGGGGGGGEVSGNSITVDFSSMGFDNAQDISTVNLSDGTTLTFSAGENKNGPKYYNSGTAIRMYPQNYFTASAGKNIASIELTCSANNAEGNVTASPGSVSTSDMTVTISGVNSKSTTITNAHTGTGATSQLRISSLKITYAE